MSRSNPMRFDFARPLSRVLDMLEAGRPNDAYHAFRRLPPATDPDEQAAQETVRQMIDKALLAQGRTPRRPTMYARPNPSAQEHKEYAKVALGYARDNLREAKAREREFLKGKTTPTECISAAMFAVQNGDRAYWNAYDARDVQTAHQAVKVVFEARQCAMRCCGETKLMDYPGHEPAEAMLFGTSVKSAKDMDKEFGNPYMGDAIEAAKSRKYGYPKPPSKKKAKPNPKKKRIRLP